MCNPGAVVAFYRKVGHQECTAYTGNILSNFIIYTFDNLRGL